MINVTVSGNTAGNSRNAPSPGDGGDGGGIYNSSSNADLTNVTVGNNAAGSKGAQTCEGCIVRRQGIGGGIAQAGGTVNLWNTIVAYNTVPADSTGPDVSGTLNSRGHNLLGNGDGATITGETTGNLVGTTTSPVDPLLDGLANNGGQTATMSLLINSPAIDAGDDAVLDPPVSLTTDQRGLARKFGTHVDIGAFEFIPPQQTSVTVTSSLNPSVVGDTVTFTATVSAATGTPSGWVQFKVDSVALGDLVTLSGGTASISTSSLTNGTHAITAEYGGDASFAPGTGTLAGGQVVSTSCEAQTAALREQINTLTQQNTQLQSQINSLNQQISNLQSQVNSLTQQNQTLQNQVNTLTEQNQTLTTQNRNLQNQLAAANRTILELRAQVAYLQLHHAQMRSAIISFLNDLQADLRATFKNPRFVIPGATPLRQLKNVQEALEKLNKGTKKEFYENLTRCKH
jgi:regulator of replication initiation timing